MANTVWVASNKAIPDQREATQSQRLWDSRRTESMERILLPVGREIAKIAVNPHICAAEAVVFHKRQCHTFAHADENQAAAALWICSVRLLRGESERFCAYKRTRIHQRRSTQDARAVSRMGVPHDGFRHELQPSHAGHGSSHVRQCFRQS